MASDVHGLAALGRCCLPTSIRTRILRFPSGALLSGLDDIEGRCDTTLIGLIWFLTEEVEVRVPQSNTAPQKYLRGRSLDIALSIKRTTPPVLPTGLLSARGKSGTCVNSNTAFQVKFPELDGSTPSFSGEYYMAHSKAYASGNRSCLCFVPTAATSTLITRTLPSVSSPERVRALRADFSVNLSGGIGTLR